MNYEILWVIGWLFTIGFMKLDFWKGVFAFFVWPYYVGTYFTKHHKKTEETN